MGVEVINLSKIYGTQKALDQVSFEAPKASITCFLGPNGAGKSTTMKIAVGYLTPTAGDVKINGISVLSNPMAIKKMVGYLPEHNPLYLEMYVREFLEFIAKAYRLPSRSIKSRIAEIVDMCGLQLEQHKKIEALSKGYRQRVGLAKALLPDPSVLILDEPTTGLDPNQIIEIRDLIKKVAQNKTVILSTHIMQEVEALSDKLVIINRGKLVADDTLKNLKEINTSQQRFEVIFDAPVSIDVLSTIGRNVEVLQIKVGVFHISGESKMLRKEIMKLVSDQDLPLASLSQLGNSLESVFQLLTQNESKKQ